MGEAGAAGAAAVAPRGARLPGDPAPLGAAAAPTSRIVSSRPHCDSVGIVAGSDVVASPVVAMQPPAAKSNAFFHARWKSPV